MKRAVARSAKGEARASTKTLERPQVAAKRPSTPPESTTAKKREKSVPPPAIQAANDNDRNASKRAAPTPIGRGRLPTGSLHTEARVPAEAAAIKQRLTALVNVQQKLGELKRSSNKNFYEIGALLHRVREERLFEVKGYSSLESFIEREVNLGQSFCRDAVRIYETFLPNAASSLGFARLSAAIRAIDDEPTGVTDTARIARSPIPPHKL
ncbi:MAG: hypothetical protein QM778_07690 [Myxococcales bacterium]